MHPRPYKENKLRLLSYQWWYQNIVQTDRPRKLETLTRTDSSAYDKQQKKGFTAPRPTHAAASICSFSSPLRALTLGCPVKWCFKETVKYHLWKTSVMCWQQPQEQRKLLTTGEAGICCNTSRTICLESQVYALMWLHDFRHIICKHSNIYVHAHIYKFIKSSLCIPPC